MFLEQLLSFIVVIGIIVFIHESGHFSMAKIFGIPVATFSLGFGPKIFGFRRKETEYKISAVPLGGYVKIHGMEDQEADPNDPNSFYNRPRYQRFLVLFMGVGFNMILALLLITVAYVRGIEVSQSSTLGSTIGAVLPNSAADKAGLKAGDEIVEMDGNPVHSWKDVTYTTLLSPGEQVPVKIKRGDQVLDTTVVPDADPTRGLGMAGYAPLSDVYVAEVVAGKPAEKIGIHKDDTIKSINGIPIHGLESTSSVVQTAGGKELVVIVERKEGGQAIQKTFHVTPEYDKEGKRWVIGFQPNEPTVVKRLGLAEAIGESYRTCKEHLVLNGLFLSKLIRGKLSLRATSGPFEIAKLSGAAARTSLTTLLLFIGTISFDIGIINLLPIPALDGGHLLFLVLEGITRRELSIRLKERVTMVGFAFLICIMVVVLYYDILRTGPVQQLLRSLGIQ